MQALVCFAHLGQQDSFRSADLLTAIGQALGKPDRLSQLRCGLSKFRAKALVVRVEGTQRYRLTPEGFRLCALNDLLQFVGIKAA